MQQNALATINLSSQLAWLPTFWLSTSQKQRQNSNQPGCNQPGCCWVMLHVPQDVLQDVLQERASISLIN